MQTKIVDKAYNFRILPNKEQQELINKNIDVKYNNISLDSFPLEVFHG